MAEFPCPCCGRLLKGISCLSLHLKISHPDYKIYSCSVHSCKRKFGSQWYSLRRHLIQCHKIPLHAKSSCELNTDTNTNNDLFQEFEYDSENSTQFDATDSGDSDQRMFSFDDFDDSRRHHVDMFISKLSSNPDFPRNLVDGMIEDIVELLSGNFMKMLKDFCFELLDKDIPNHERCRLSQIFDKLGNPFQHVSSEFKRFKYFKSQGNFIVPQSYTIDSRIENVNKNGPRMQMKDVTSQFIPLREVLKKFYELPDAYSETVAYMKELESESSMLQNFIQCEIWKRKRANYGQNDIVFPLFFFFDDFEPNNVLGLHCESLEACYICLPCLPTCCQSKLENIFLVLLFNADDRKMYGNYKTFKPLLEELKFLETDGILIDLPDGPKRVFFITGLVMGDNKGIHEICGFSEGFNARHSCRMCKASKMETETMVVEDLSLIRTVENYADDVNANNFGLTGVHENCIFTYIPSFEMPSDMAVDIFHDGHEGVCHYSMIAILKYFQSKNPSFIEVFNNRMYVCDYGIDSDNKPPSICIERLTTNKLKMTGSEMLTFVKLFGVFVGDLVDEDDEHWQLFLLLHDIMTATTRKELPKDLCRALPLKVKDHHELYIKLTKQCLKPKHHHLVHYARIIEAMGPVALFSTIRCEAKHKSLKLTANVCSSRVNLPYTVAVKQQLALGYRLTCNQSIMSSKLVVGPGSVVTSRVPEESE